MNRTGLAAAALLWLCTLATPAHGDPVRLEGFGRATVGVGWRLTPNDHFYARAAEAGHPVATRSPGGPAACLCLGYSATDALEVGIDLHASFETLRLVDAAPINSVTYGALVGLRLQWAGLLSGALVPYVGIFTGPTLVYVSSPDFQPLESLSAAWAGGAGATIRLSDSLGITVDYKLLLARGMVPGISSVNGGGSLLTVGLSFIFPPEPLPGESPR